MACNVSKLRDHFIFAEPVCLMCNHERVGRDVKLLPRGVLCAKCFRMPVYLDM